MDAMHSDMRRRMSWYVVFSWSWGSPGKGTEYTGLFFVFARECLKEISCVVEFCIGGGAGAELPIREAGAVQ
jgi:hypothetical protein